MQPLLVVRLLTYNHEKYIRQCLDGILIQKTDFPFIVIIGEDCSTDLTAEICREYESKYPSLFQLHCNKVNNISVNSFNNWELCVLSNAKYIALLEGDDYWTDPNKLQKQIDFLEANSDYAICFHNVMILNNGELLEDTFTAKTNSETTILDLIQYRNYINTVSVVFRNKIIKFPPQLATSPIADYFIYILLTEDGSKIKKLDDKMAIYRRGVGIHSKETVVNQLWAWYEMLILLKNYYYKNNIFRDQLEEIKNNIEVEVINTKFADSIEYKLKTIELLKIFALRILKKLHLTRG